MSFPISLLKIIYSNVQPIVGPKGTYIMNLRTLPSSLLIGVMVRRFHNVDPSFLEFNMRPHKLFPTCITSLTFAPSFLFVPSPCKNQISQQNVAAHLYRSRKCKKLFYYSYVFWNSTKLLDWIVNSSMVVLIIQCGEGGRHTKM